jgi:hypothetical protein
MKIGTTDAAACFGLARQSAVMHKACQTTSPGSVVTPRSCWIRSLLGTARQMSPSHGTQRTACRAPVGRPGSLAAQTGVSWYHAVQKRVAPSNLDHPRPIWYARDQHRTPLKRPRAVSGATVLERITSAIPICLERTQGADSPAVSNIGAPFARVIS